MNVHKHGAVNPLTCPVAPGDIVIAESGERYLVKQNMAGHYWLQHAASGFDLTHPEPGQLAICRRITELVNV